MSPLNYAAVLIDNVDETFDSALSYAGIHVKPFGHELLVGEIGLGFIIEFLVVIATTSPVSIGLATSALFLGTCGLAAWLAGRIEILAGARVG
jgi:hypothetical protein